VLVTFKNEITEEDLKHINYQRLKLSGKTAMLTVCGDTDSEIAKLNAMEIETLESERLTLEEVFIEEISDKFRKVLVTFKNEITEEDLKHINYQRLKLSGKTAMLTVCGDTDAEIAKLNAMEIETLESERLTLEEVFIEETVVVSEN
jgi:hypothetical protein